MNDIFDESSTKNYSVDYRSIYNKNTNKINNIKSRATGLCEIKDNEKFDCKESNEIIGHVKEDENDNLLLEIFSLIKVSFRILTAVFIILLCVGLLGLTVHLINQDTSELEKNHLPYTLLCMLKGDKSEEVN